ncbi:MAG: archease [Methanocorpusculum sp.]|nr:archease [Methanocorpusculum sp.]
MVFEELEHTADILMKISAPTLTELFSESGFALSKTLYGNYSEEEPSQSFEIEAKGDDLCETVVNFLSELLFITETEYLVPQSFELEADEKSVFGKVSGVSFDRAKHAGGIEVKGISYSGLTLTKTDTGFELQIIFDI